MSVTLNPTEIRHRAHHFSREFSDAHYELGEAQNFIRGLCDVFGFSNKRLVSFEQRVKKRDGRRGRIDGFYPGKLLIEMKSRGEKLDVAYQQAIDYLPGLTDAELPDYVLVSDFEHMHLHTLDGRTPAMCHKLADFSEHLDSYLFLAGYESQAQQDQIAVDESAARHIAQLHDAMRDGGYTGVDLQRYLVRLLFCLFAEDTGIFDRAGSFGRYLRQHTREDGSDLDGALQNLFDVLNRAPALRPKNLPLELAGFPYVNGSVFDGQLARCYFNSAARSVLLHCAEHFDWAQISPAIFGSLFQAVIHHDNEGVIGKSTKRRELGAHYTSETNILRVIGPLFLDSLKGELHTARGPGGSVARLHKLLARLRNINCFDPACGCGNFLVIAYREIRRLELDAVEALQTIESRSRGLSDTLDVKEFGYIQCDVHQFHGIEIEASAAHIATVALWLTDHQENLRASRVLGGNFNRLPLVRRANIVCANALTTDWASVLLPELCDYVIGNPPFVGKKEQSAEQKASFQPVMEGVHGAGVLDFVAAWYVKAARYLSDAAARTGQAPGAHEPAAPKSRPTPAPYAPPRNRSFSVRTRCAFVSTNSITQGEQVGVLWGWMLAQGMKIQFAHRTFQWSNDAKGVAAVHCVIIGFGTDDLPGKTIFAYPDIQGEPVAISAKNINPYLVDGPDVVLSKRGTSICGAKTMSYGSMAIDNGHLILTEDERIAVLSEEPGLHKYLRPFMGGAEFLNAEKRWCFWLETITPSELRTSRILISRVEAVKNFRLGSGRSATQKLAQTPALFGENRQPSTGFLLLPKVSSENRQYLPVGFMGPEIVANGSALVVAQANMADFAVLQSAMHMAWMRASCGRLESRYQYSAGIVYNNFPWPDLPELAADFATGATPIASGPAPSPSPSQKKRATIEAAAQSVLDARASFPEASLADLYDPLAMPPTLTKAHQQLDKAVDAAYAYKGQPDDASRVAFLFGLYEQMTSAFSNPKKLPAKDAI